MPNKRGATAAITRALAARNINIEYFYATATPGADHTVGIFRVSDTTKALDIEFST